MIFPVVLALLGDNPMQSEMACHIGLAGRKFCRVCEAENDKGLKMPLGTDFPGSSASPADLRPSGPADENDIDNPDLPSAIYDTGSDASQPGSPVEGTRGDSPLPPDLLLEPTSGGSRPPSSASEASSNASSRRSSLIQPRQPTPD